MGWRWAFEFGARLRVRARPGRSGSRPDAAARLVARLQRQSWWRGSAPNSRGFWLVEAVLDVRGREGWRRGDKDPRGRWEVELRWVGSWGDSWIPYICLNTAARRDADRLLSSSGLRPQKQQGQARDSIRRPVAHLAAGGLVGNFPIRACSARTCGSTFDLESRKARSEQRSALGWRAR